MVQLLCLGKKTATATLFKLLNPEMLYAYCYGHAMNLAVKDVYFKAAIIKEPFVIIWAIIKLVKDSLQWETKVKSTTSNKNNTKKKRA